jgi:beta-lactam-binding protein with PASTA domain
MCVVPGLAGKSIGQARSALTTAHCALGTVTKPKPKKHQKLVPLVVKSSSPEAGTTMAANSRVNLKLGPKAKQGNK